MTYIKNLKITIENDTNRTTKLGRFLRRSSIDELGYLI